MLVWNCDISVSLSICFDLYLTVVANSIFVRQVAFQCSTQQHVNSPSNKLNCVVLEKTKFSFFSRIIEANLFFKIVLKCICYLCHADFKLRDLWGNRALLLTFIYTAALRLDSNVRGLTRFQAEGNWIWPSCIFHGRLRAYPSPLPPSPFSPPPGGLEMCFLAQFGIFFNFRDKFSKVLSRN